MASIQVFNESTGLTYYIDYSVEAAVVNGNGTGYPNYYIKVSTSQKVIGTGATVPAEIVLTLPGSGDVTEEMKEKSVIIMDKVAGGTLMSSSSSQSSVSSGGSSRSSISSSNSSSQTTGSWSSTVP